MKAFVNQQKADLRSTKNLYRKVQQLTSSIPLKHVDFMGPRDVCCNRVCFLAMRSAKHTIHYLQELDENVKLGSQEKKQLYSERKMELVKQQQLNEDEHLHVLRQIADHDTTEFRQTVQTERHTLEKRLLQDVSN